MVDKVEDLAASLQATTEVLSTADRMLEHYRDINVEQDEEIAKVCPVKCTEVLTCKKFVKSFVLFWNCIVFSNLT